MKTIQEKLKPKVIDIIMANPQYRLEVSELMKSPEWGEAMFNDWINDKVREKK